MPGPRFLTTLALLLFISGCSINDTETMRIGTNQWPGYEPLYLASDLQNWPDKNQYKLIEYPSASEVLRAFRNRSLEAASLTLDEALLLKHDGIPIKIILVHDFSNGADVILAKHPIKNVSQLRGKSIAVESSALGSFFLNRALQINHLSESDVNIKNYDVNMHEKAWLNKDIDAVVTFDPVRTRLINQGANEVFSSKQIPGEIVDVLVVHEDFAIKNRRIIKQLIDNWFYAIDHMRKNTDDAYKFIAARTQLSLDEIHASYELLKIPDRNQNYVMLSNEGSLIEVMYLLNNTLLSIGRINNSINIDNLLDNQFISK